MHRIAQLALIGAIVTFTGGFGGRLVYETPVELREAKLHNDNLYLFSENNFIAEISSPDAVHFAISGNGKHIAVCDNATQQGLAVSRYERNATPDWVLFGDALVEALDAAGVRDVETCLAIRAFEDDSIGMHLATSSGSSWVKINQAQAGFSLLEGELPSLANETARERAAIVDGLIEIDDVVVIDEKRTALRARDFDLWLAWP